jgi:predicted regulator of Ras-like GTPase activity (Roadblock/LC7/MglB family)
MFGFLKKFLPGRFAAKAAAQDALQDSSPGGLLQGSSDNFHANGTNGHANGGASRNGNGSANGNGHQNGQARPEQKTRRTVDISLRGILAILPSDLVSRVKQSEVSAMTITVGVDKVLSQLSRGVVKISFGELRKLAPHIFTEEVDRDKVLVPLPLEEILSQINPATIARKIAQKHIEVPPEISSPFDPANKGAICAVGPAKPAQAAAVAPQPAAPAPRIEKPAPRVEKTAPPEVVEPEPKAMPVIPMVPVNRGALTSSPTPPPPSATFPIPMASVSAVRPIKDLFVSNAAAPAAQTLPAPASAPAPVPLSVAAPVPVVPPVPEVPPILINLASMAETWPEAVRKDIVQFSLLDALVALPFDVVEQGLKQGRLSFQWKTLRSWIKPAPLPSVSAHDHVLVELPLKTIAPLYLARQKDADRKKQPVSVDHEIPNLFFGFPQPEHTTPQPALVTKPADTNYYNFDEEGKPIIDPSDEKAPTPGTRFLSRYATPNEVVSRASMLEGVVGALITLPDGLMVASRISADLNADTLAAFLPQIFGKVAQCTKELRMGQLNNLNFTVGNVPWKIFRVNSIFFAAFGKPGEGLPTAQLAALAADLDHKPK